MTMTKYRTNEQRDRCPESGKVCMSHDDARRAARTLNQRQARDRWPVDAYRCPDCGHWHTGHVHTRRRHRQNRA